MTDDDFADAIEADNSPAAKLLTAKDAEIERLRAALAERHEGGAAMTDLRKTAASLLSAVDLALPYAPHRHEWDHVADAADDLRAALAAEQAQPRRVDFSGFFQVIDGPQPTTLEWEDEKAAEQAPDAEALRAEVEALRRDAERLDWIASVVNDHSSFWLLPCGEDLRFVQVRHFGDCANYPTVNGVRAAIDAARAQKED